VVVHRRLNNGAGFARAGTVRRFARFSAMKIPEENCNMVLLAAVTLVSMAVAGGAALLGPPDTNQKFADRTFGYAVPAPSPDKRIITVSDQPPVRVVGAPFVLNTNPRER
jgi:hypothetical protein